MKYKILVTSDERTQIMAALFRYGYGTLADRFYQAPYDSADDGPEVAILREKPEGWDG